MVVGHYHLVGVHAELARRAARAGRRGVRAMTAAGEPARRPPGPGRRRRHADLGRPRHARSATAGPSPCSRPGRGRPWCAPTATATAAGGDRATGSRDEGGTRRGACVGDVTEEAACRAMVEPRPARAVATGSCSTSASVADAASRAPPPRTGTSTFAVNLRSHFLVVRRRSPQLRRRRRRSCSSARSPGLQPGSRLPAYDASKAGLIGLCRHVAIEGAGGHPCERRRPGLIDTPLGRWPRGTTVAATHAGTARAPGHGVGGRRGHGRSCSPTTRATSRARPWPSTGASA